MSFIKVYELYYRRSEIWKWEAFQFYDKYDKNGFHIAVDMKRKLITVFGKDNVKLEAVKHYQMKGY